jgi:peptidyl-prolyl cis-trans isomerase SDCCAG10
MSQNYMMEPATNGKVVLRTSAGDIDIELWSKETLLACRNFVQLCMENYYDATIFHRLVPGFIIQGGDPTGTGMGGESIFGKPFKDEIHSRVGKLVFAACSGLGNLSTQEQAEGQVFYS